MTGVLRLVVRWRMRGFVRNILGQVGLVDVVALPSTLVCPCVATLGGLCVATLGSPLDRVVRNFLIICNHCVLPFTEGGSSAFIFCSRSAAASIVRSSLDMVGILQCCGYNL